MKNLLKLSTVLFFLSFASCTTEPLVEENPQSEIIQAAGFDINIEGTFNGEPITLSHTSILEKNYPVTGTAPRAHLSNFSRKNEFSDVVAVDQIIVGLTAELDEGQLLSTAFIGLHEYRDLADIEIPGEAFLGDVRINGERYSTAFDPQENPFNTFEITGVSQIENDDKLDPKYIDKLFMVEGRFSCLLSVVGDNDYTDELVVDHFSLIFSNE